MTEESADLTGGMNRRGFLGTGAGALAAARLARCRPRGCPPGLHQQARLRQAAPPGRGLPRLTRHRHGPKATFALALHASRAAKGPSVAQFEIDLSPPRSNG